MDEPRISVVMSVFNPGPDLARAVGSVLAQTLAELELVLVDDASTDESARWMEELQERDHRVVVLHNQENLGLAASLNRGWRRARGELVARMDADDESLPTRLELQVRKMEEEPGIAVLGTGVELVSADGMTLGTATRPESHEDLVGRIYRENPFFHPTVVMRKTFLEEVGGYDATLRRAQDLDLWLRSYRTHRFHNLQEPLLRYTVRKPTVRALAYGARVLFRAVAREEQVVRKAWFPLRFLLAGLATWVGVRRHPLTKP